MKLVDILARELNAWPETTRLAQDLNGHVFGWTGFPNWDGHQWLIDAGASLDKCRPGEMDLADDHMTASVTRAEWQAAVDALNADKCEHSYANNIGCPECGELNAPKVVDWDEFGFPPAGVSCEFTSNDGYNWKPCRILYADELSILTGELEGKADRRLLRKCDADVKFRPARTAEQVAAEERKSEILEMIDTFGTDTAIWGRDAVMEICGHLWEAGYRKQVAK